MSIRAKLNRIFDQLFGFRFFSNSIARPDVVQPHPPIKPDIFFQALSIVEKTPGNNLISEKEFLSVIHKSKSYWSLFRCPCRCGDVITLSLQDIHNPKWKVEKSLENRPTISPSIWRTEGCFSHFWILDGRVYWCKNTGVEPWVAEPKYYSKPADK